jgi:hypothetical protein
VFGETLGMMRTNELFAARHFLPDAKGMPLQEFSSRIAFELVNNAFWRGENVGPSRGVGAPDCEHVKLPQLGGSSRRVRQTTCRYCAHDCSHYCPKCSIAAGASQRERRESTSFFGICNSAERGCWAMHVTGDTPSKQTVKRPKRTPKPGV